MKGEILKEANAMMGHDGIIKKLENSDNRSLPSVAGDVCMSAHISCVESCTCTRCSFNHANAQKAIRFSHHQIHDMECFVMRLMKEFKSMKHILEENLSPQPFPSADSPSRISEVEAFNYRDLDSGMHFFTNHMYLPTENIVHFVPFIWQYVVYFFL